MSKYAADLRTTYAAGSLTDTDSDYLSEPSTDAKSNPWRQTKQHILLLLVAR